MQILSDEQKVRLLEEAAKAAERAYAPYSNYKVGAAIMTSSGSIYIGANIENASYGATVCAERSAIVAMVMAQETEIVAIAVHTPDQGYPCGICLQAISEFTKDPKQCKIVVPSNDGAITRTLAEIAPYLWHSDIVRPIRLQ